MVNKRVCLISLPNENTGLEYSVLLYDMLPEIRKYYETIELIGDDTIPERVWYEIREREPYLLFHIGHGEKTITTSQYYLDLFWIPTSISGHIHNDSNVGMLSDMVVYLLSCRCGYPGGLCENIAKYAKACVGYADYWYWIVDRSKPPHEDQYAKSFFRAASSFMTRFASGYSVEESFRYMIDEYTNEANYWLEWIEKNPDAPEGSKVAAMLTAYYLIQDRNVAVFYGEGSEVNRVSMLPILAGFAIPIFIGSVLSKK